MGNGFGNVGRPLQTDKGAKKQGFRNVIGRFCLRLKEPLLSTYWQNANLLDGKGVLTGKIRGMFLGIGDKPIGASKALLLPPQQASALARGGRKFLALKDLLIKGTDQRIKHQGNALASGPTAGGGNIPLTEAGHPNQINISKPSQSRLQIGSLGKPWLKGLHLPAQLGKAAHQGTIARIVRAVVAKSPPPKNDAHLDNPRIIKVRFICRRHCYQIIAHTSFANVSTSTPLQPDRMAINTVHCVAPAGT